MRRTFGAVTVECVQGDITSQDDVEAVVNAANARLEPGGGVAGAIHRAAGPGLAEEAVPLGPISPARRSSPARTGFRTVTSSTLWDQSTARTAPRQSSWRAATATHSRSPRRTAIESIAFPAISTGIFGYPVEEAAGVALGTIRGEADSLQHVTPRQVRPLR